MRLKSVLSLLQKLVRVEMSLMSDGSAFQARDPSMEKALLVTRSRQKLRMLTLNCTITSHCFGPQYALHNVHHSEVCHGIQVTAA